MGKSILIVEDDMIIAMVLENMVKTLGHQVLGKATNGDDAISLATSLNPDIILMDIRLKGEMDGVEAIQIIKEKMSTVSVIFITGNSDRHNFDRVKETNCVGLITKPFTIGELTKTLELAS
jgi:CheY-like chemotaxis protein